MYTDINGETIFAIRTDCPIHGLAPCSICGSTGFHRPSCALYSYQCAICGARISNGNAMEHTHKPLPLYVGKPDDVRTTLDNSGGTVSE